MAEFLMPSLGADMEAGTLVEWMVKPGDAVKRGQVVAVVETQKGAVEVEIWQDGTIEKLVVEPHTKVPVGAVLATLRAAGEPAAPAQGAPAAAAAPPAAAPEAPSSATRARVAPAARKLAEELGVDINTVQPAEPGAVVSRADVERAAKAGTGAAPAKPAAIPHPFPVHPSPPPLSRAERGDSSFPSPLGRRGRDEGIERGNVERANGGPSIAASIGRLDWHAQMRKAIAAAMTRSKREIPHYYLATEIDATAVTGWLAAENAKRSVAERLLPVVPMMKAVALALKEVPELNGFWIDGAFKPSAAVHLGMAIAMRGGGLVAPAIHDADRKSPDELMAALRDLITRVRGGRLRSSEMADPTVTLTSLGEQGVETVFGAIYPPQVAIIGLGKVTERPRVHQGAVAARQALTATLAADHRVSDGHRGALFLSALARLLQNPEKL